MFLSYIHQRRPVELPRGLSGSTIHFEKKRKKSVKQRWWLRRSSSSTDNDHSLRRTDVSTTTSENISIQTDRGRDRQHQPTTVLACGTRLLVDLPTTGWSRANKTKSGRPGLSAEQFYLWEALVDLPEDMVVQVPSLVQVVQTCSVQPRTL